MKRDDWTCDECGTQLQIGDHPYCPHGIAQRGKGFEPFFHVGIGQNVTGVGDINKAMRPHWDGDRYIHLQHRDKPDVYYRELNERREARREESRKQR